MMVSERRDENKRRGAVDGLARRGAAWRGMARRGAAWRTMSAGERTCS